MMLATAVTVVTVLVLCVIAALIIHRRHPHTSNKTEPDYEPTIADFSWGKQNDDRTRNLRTNR